MHSLPSGWNALLVKLGFTRKKRRAHGQRMQLTKSLRIERLETRRALAITVDIFTDEADGFIDDGDISLRDAIFRAPVGETINFASTLNGTTIALLPSLGQFTFGKNLTIDGGNLGITIDGNDPTGGFHNNGDGIRIFNIEDPTNGTSPPSVTMVGLTLTGADPALTTPGPQGGAIRSEGRLTLRNMVIAENGADFGAAVYVEVAGGSAMPRDVLVIENSRIEDNSAFEGGAVFVRFSQASEGHDTVRINQSLLSGNIAGPRPESGRGGALYVTGGGGLDSRHSVLATSTRFEENSAGEGGAIYHFASATPIDLSLLQKSSVTGNTATTGAGGGIYSNTNGGSRLVIQNSTISGNLSETDGGGVSVRLSPTSSLMIEDSTVAANTAGNDGGGVFVVTTRNDDDPFPAPRAVTIIESLISGNTASSRGGGLYSRNFAGTETLVEASRITGNVVPSSGVSKRNGGGIYAYVYGNSTGEPVNKPRFTISSSTVDNNDADNEGGGIFVCAKYFGDFVAVNSTLSGNRTLSDQTGGGGGIMIARFGPQSAVNESVDAFLTNMTITQNSSLDGGGVKTADLDNVRVRIANSIIAENWNFQGPPPTPGSAPSNLVGRIDVANAQYNLVGTGSPILNLNGQSAALDSTNISSDQPLLNPLSNNGGPTPTHALRYEPQSSIVSPAIDAGSNGLATIPLSGSPGTPLATDQRGAGFLRSFDVAGVTLSGRGPVDIGAYELGLAKVVDVTISSSTAVQALHPPHHYAANNASGPQAGSGRQLQTVPVGGADTVSIRFSTSVNNATLDGALGVIGLETGHLPLITFVGYDVNIHTATWRVANWIAHDQYLIRVNDVVTDAAGNALDGEWVNPKQLYASGGSGPYYANAAISEFPSGDDAAGGDFNFLVTLLHGDLNLNNRVGVTTDINPAVASVGMGSGMTWDDGDFTGNGSVGVTTDINPALANLADGWNFQVVFIAGDFSGDGYVDGPDFLLWQRNRGTLSGAVHGDGDANGDGDVDDDDYDLLVIQWNFEIMVSLV